jgi:Flp pilus assembly protein TadD
MHLSDFMDIYMPKYKGHEDEFIMASHAQRLQKSKCFIASSKHDGKKGHASLTCITCHNPHVSVKVTGQQVFNNACAGCHNMQTDCRESMQERAKVNDNCNKCHMPRSGTIDIPHVSVTDHWIHVPAPKSVQDKVKEFAGIYCINNPGSDESMQCRAYLNYYEKFEGEKNSLDSAVTRLPSAKDNAEEFTDMQIHLLYLKRNFPEIIRLTARLSPASVTSPWLCYRAGQAFQSAGRAPEAEPWYRRAVQLAGENLEFINKLGTILIAGGKLKEGIEILNSSLQRNPKQAAAWTNIGFGHLRDGDTQLAMRCYDEAIALDPDFEQALLNKAGLLNFMGKKTEAALVLKRILKRNPQNTEVRKLLQSLQS